MAEETAQIVTEYPITTPMRWDNLAYKATGDATRMSEIIELNPDIPLDVIIPAGTKVFVPIIEEESVNQNLLPPWMRP